MMAKLKPCPFCGKSVAECAGLTDIEMIDEDNEFYEMWNDHVAVVCDPNKGGCGSMTSGQHYSREAAIEAWNMRATEMTENRICIIVSVLLFLMTLAVGVMLK